MHAVISRSDIRGTKMNTDSETLLDTGLFCLVFMARFLRMPVDGEQLRHGSGRLSEPFSAQDILRAAKRLGFRARRSRIGAGRLDSCPMPVISEMKDGSFVILAAVAPLKVLIRDPREERVTELPREEFEQRWSERLILLTTRTGAASVMRRFDFSWFIPEIVRYRRSFGEILLVSLFVQVIALVTPVFFQLVIDKVLVHHGLSTLYVLVIGLAAVSVAGDLPHGVAQLCAGAHGGQDGRHARLAHVSAPHALPISYFEARQTGQSVARIRELENVRAFLTGSALTSCSMPCSHSCCSR